MVNKNHATNATICILLKTNRIWGLFDRIFVGCDSFFHVVTQFVMDYCQRMSYVVVLLPLWTVLFGGIIGFGSDALKEFSLFVLVSLCATV